MKKAKFMACDQKLEEAFRKAEARKLSDIAIATKSGLSWPDIARCRANPKQATIGSAIAVITAIKALCAE